MDDLRIPAVAAPLGFLKAIEGAASPTCTPEEALQRLGSSRNGLTTKEAEARQSSVGPNEVAHDARHTIVGRDHQSLD